MPSLEAALDRIVRDAPDPAALTYISVKNKLAATVGQDLVAANTRWLRQRLRDLVYLSRHTDGLGADRVDGDDDGVGLGLRAAFETLVRDAPPGEELTYMVVKKQLVASVGCNSFDAGKVWIQRRLQAMAAEGLALAAGGGTEGAACPTARLATRAAALDCATASEPGPTQMKPRGLSALVCYGFKLKLVHLDTHRHLCSNMTHYPAGSRQQVVGCSAKGSGSGGSSAGDFWVMKPRGTYAGAYLRGRPVWHGDVVRLEHVQTGRNLHGQPVREPVPAEQPAAGGGHEVSCFGSQDTETDRRDDWRVECVDAKIGAVGVRRPRHHFEPPLACVLQSAIPQACLTRAACCRALHPP